MNRREQTGFSHPAVREIHCFGDSHTYNAVWGNLPTQFYCSLLSVELNNLGASVRCRNFGVSGNTSSQVLTRVIAGQHLQYGVVPTLSVVYCGQNDSTFTNTVAASPAPTSSVFTLATNDANTSPAVTAIATSYSVGGHLLVGGMPCVVTANNGANPPQLTVTGLVSPPATGATVVCDTRANIQNIVSILKTAGCTKFVIVGQHYMNFTSGGDSTSTPYAPYAVVRASQQAAVSAVGAEAIYADVYGLMRGLIVAGTVTAGNDTAWHVLVGNSHLNAYGEKLIAQSIQTAITDAGWLPLLS